MTHNGGDFRGPGATEQHMWLFLLGVRSVLRSVCPSGKGDGMDDDFGGWVCSESDGQTARYGGEALEQDEEGGQSAEGDDVTSEIFLTFLARGLSMCADGVGDLCGGVGEEPEEQEKIRLRNQKTFSWVACAIRLAGEGIRRVVWGNVRVEIHSFLCMALDLHARDEACVGWFL